MPAIGYAQSPNALLGAMQRPMNVNWQNPGSIMSAIGGLTPDIHQTWSQGSSQQLQPFGGGGGGGASAFDQAVSGGGSRGYSFGGSQQGEGSWGTSGQSAKIGALGSAIPAAYRQQQFNSVLPLMGGVYSGLRSVGGQSTAPPPITTAPIWNPQQIQGQVNLMRGTNNASAQSQNKLAGQQLAGRGMGGQSPLLSALQQGNNLGALAQNTSGENNLRWNAAQGNAQQVLQEQTAAGNLWNQAMQQDIARRQMQTQLGSSYLGALAGLV